MCSEIIKFLIKKPLEKHRNISCNLGIPFFILSSLYPPVIYKDSEYPIYCGPGPIKSIPKCNSLNIQYLIMEKILLSRTSNIGRAQRKIEKYYVVDRDSHDVFIISEKQR